MDKGLIAILVGCYLSMALPTIGGFVLASTWSLLYGVVLMIVGAIIAMIWTITFIFAEGKQQHRMRQ